MNRGAATPVELRTAYLKMATSSVGAAGTSTVTNVMTTTTLMMTMAKIAPERNNMKNSFWLITKKSGVPRITKTRPAMKWDEIAIYVSLEMPDEVFQRPTISAKINISHQPKVEIDAETVNNIEEVLKQDGINVKLTIEDTEE